MDTFLIRKCRKDSSLLATFRNDRMGEGGALCAEVTSTIGYNPGMSTLRNMPPSSTPTVKRVTVTPATVSEPSVTRRSVTL